MLVHLQYPWLLAEMVEACDFLCTSLNIFMTFHLKFSFILYHIEANLTIPSKPYWTLNKWVRWVGMVDLTVSGSSRAPDSSVYYQASWLQVKHIWFVPNLIQPGSDPTPATIIPTCSRCQRFGSCFYQYHLIHKPLQIFRV